MAVALNTLSKTFFFAEGQHLLTDIFEHFEVREGRCRELLRMFAVVHKKYYGYHATPSKLKRCFNDFVSKRELPTSVLSIYCVETNRIPTHLAEALSHR